jgi:hypothetical protein
MKEEEGGLILIKHFSLLNKYILYCFMKKEIII